MTVIGIGVDIVEIERFRTVLERTPSIRHRMFVASEIDDAAVRPDPVPSLAARFASREAVMKALGLGLGAFDFHDVWVRRLDTGAPMLMIEGRAAELATRAGVRRWHLSISHTDTTAIAYVVAE